MTRYTPYGETRYNSGLTPSDYRYTGQLQQAELGLYFYVSRWFDPALGRFIQADSIIPGAGNPMAWDRYMYVFGNPLRFSDPGGHGACDNIPDASARAHCESSQGQSSNGISLDDMAQEYGITFSNGWNNNDKLFMLLEIMRMGDRLMEAYLDYLGPLCAATQGCQGINIVGSSGQLTTSIFGDKTITLTSSSTSYYCQAFDAGPTCYNITGMDEFENRGVITHEFGHLFAHRINGEWGYSYSILGASTITDIDGNYVEGIPLEGGAWRRTTKGYGGEGRPFMQHSLTMDAAGLTTSEDFADMYMNWVQNTFATDMAGRARYAWMDSYMGQWVYSSTNR